MHPKFLQELKPQESFNNTKIYTQVDEIMRWDLMLVFLQNFYEIA
jgi:hypothetical protein